MNKGDGKLNNNHSSSSIDSNQLNEMIDEDSGRYSENSDYSDKVKASNKAVKNIKGNKNKSKSVDLNDLLDSPDKIDDHLEKGKERDKKLDDEERKRKNKEKERYKDKSKDRIKKFAGVESEADLKDKDVMVSTIKNITKMLINAYLTTSGKIKLGWAALTSGIVWIFLTPILFLFAMTLTFVILMSGVAVLLMSDSSVGNSGSSNTASDGTSETETSGNVSVPKGYEGKIMYPINSTHSYRGFIPGGHKGLDIGEQNGDKIYPVYPGKVLLSGKGKPQCPNSGNDPGCQTLLSRSDNTYFTGDGNAVQIIHNMGGGKYMISYYMHMTPNTIKVKEGQSVGYGTELGIVGNSGNSNGYHLHLEIYDDVPKEFYTKGKAAYKTIGDSYNFMMKRLTVPSPLFTCGGKSGVVKNNGGPHTIPSSCVEDAKKARKK